jgi:hypothetical protein
MCLVSDRRVLPDDDLQSVRRWRPNILLIAPPTAAADLLPLLLSRCRPPVHEICGGHLTVMPDAGTVVLHDLDELDTGAQRELFRWLEAQDGRVQVVSVAPAPLFPLVAGGGFSEALFYRLNVVTLHNGQG